MLVININIFFSYWLCFDSCLVWWYVSVSYSLLYDFNGCMINLVGLYGILLEDNNFSYSMQIGYVGGGNGDNGSIGYIVFNYCGGYGNVNVGYSCSDGFKQFYYGVSGGVLVYVNGIILS